MEQNTLLCDFVYHDIVTDIYIGKLKMGDELPTLTELCETYGIGRNTARSAMRLLSDHGYIRALNRKKTVVTFDFNNPRCRHLYLTELSERRSAIADLFRLMALIMPGIAVFCVNSATNFQRNTLARMAGCAVSPEVHSERGLFLSLFAVYKYALSIPQNELLLSLFEAMFQFVQVPVSLVDRKSRRFHLAIPIIRIFLKNFEKLIQAGDDATLQKQLVRFCNFAEKTTSSHLTRVCSNLLDTPQVGFRWAADRRQDRLYLSLIMDILGKITSGVYQPGDPLPSYADLARQYRVSEKTSRKAVSILNRLRIVRIENGKNTCVAPRCEFDISKTLQNQAIYRNLLRFFEALQIMVLICRPVIRKALESLPLDCIEKKRQICRESDSRLLVSWMDLFFGAVPSQSLNNIYEQLKNTLAWGNLLEFFMAGNKKAPFYIDFTDLDLLFDECGPSQADKVFYTVLVRVAALMKQFSGEIGLFLPSNLFL